MSLFTLQVPFHIHLFLLCFLDLLRSTKVVCVNVGVELSMGVHQWTHNLKAMLHPTLECFSREVWGLSHLCDSWLSGPSGIGPQYQADHPGCADLLMAVPAMLRRWRLTAFLPVFLHYSYSSFMNLRRDGLNILFRTESSIIYSHTFKIHDPLHLLLSQAKRSFSH